MKPEENIIEIPHHPRPHGSSGYLVEVCTYGYTSDILLGGIGRYVKYRFDWVHLGYSESLWRDWNLSQVEDALAEWAEKEGRYVEYVKELSATSGLLYGNHHGNTFFDVEVLFEGRDKSKVILVGADNESKVKNILRTEKVAKIISITKSKVQYHIGCKLD